MTLGTHVMSTSWHTSRIMISNLLSFLHSYSLGPSKAKLLEDIQRAGRFYHPEQGRVFVSYRVTQI